MIGPGGRPSPYQVGFLLVESVIMLVGAFMAVYIRLYWDGSLEELFTGRYALYRLLVVPVALQVTFYYSDLHNFRVARPFPWTLARVAQAMLVGSLALSILYYLVPVLFLGRGVMVLSLLTITPVVLLWRAIYGWALSKRLLSTRVLMIGSGRLADAIFEELVGRSDNYYQVVCLLDVTPPEQEEAKDAPVNLMEIWGALLRAEVRRDAEELTGLVRFYGVDLIVVASDDEDSRLPIDAMLECRMLGIPIVSGEGFFESFANRLLADSIRPLWIIYSPGFRASGLRRFTKRAMDFGLSIVGLVVSLPLALAVAVAIKIDSKGPALYSQERVGQGGATFNIIKFRSMVTNAEAETGPVWATEDDPRITRVGRFIRRTRLDEIPQMWTVLKGDMSFVGPRPERPHFVEELSRQLPYYNERHNVKPGITGWAQVCYPYGSSLAASLEKLNYDLYYIKHSSLSLDLMIIMRTLKILIFGGGGR